MQAPQYIEEVSKVLEKCQHSAEYNTTVKLMESIHQQAQQHGLELVVSPTVMYQYNQLNTVDVRAYYPLVVIALVLLLEYKYMHVHRGHGGVVIDATDMVRSAGFNDQLYSLSDYFVRYMLVRHGYETTHSAYSRAAKFMFSLFSQGRSGFESIMARLVASSTATTIPTPSKL